MLAALGLLFCVLGNFMPKFRHNYFCGIKSPWALADEENWRRTHRFAGPLWFWGGLGVAVLSFVLPEAAMFAASFAVFFGTGAGAVRIFVHFVQKSARKYARFLVAFGPPVRYTRVS